MRSRVFLTAVSVFFLALQLSFANAEPTLQQRYLDIYLKINEAEHLEQKGDDRGAMDGFKDCSDKLAKLHQESPNWETALVIKRISDCNARVVDMQSKLDTGLALTSSPTNSASNKSPVAEEFRDYPWKKDIITTEFWIGERSNHASAWDEHWQSNNHGVDTPGDRDAYVSAGHAAAENPFYVALPFNDLAFPDKARKWLPSGWQQPLKDGKHVSACKDRWVEIKNSQGEICYAQWEDVGPERNDHAEYVFGEERPMTGIRAGLEVSPAVAQYLSIDDKNQLTAWRFVDAENVPPGSWLKYDEQAVLYAALHQQVKNSDSQAGPDIKKGESARKEAQSANAKIAPEPAGDTP